MTSSARPLSGSPAGPLAGPPAPADGAPGPAVRHSRLVRASPVYYGWVIVLAATLALGMTLPGQTAGMALFIDAFIADLGLGRGQVALLYTAATLLAAATLPIMGRMFDRHGPRRGAIAIVLAFSAACFAMGHVAGPVSLFLGFVAMRALGQGGLGLVSLHAVTLWFVQRRGVAVGLMGTGLALTTAFGVPLIAQSIAQIGWRETYVAMAGVLLLGLLPVAALLFRREPERYGLVPDGRAPDAAVPAERAYTLAEARRTPIFWLLVGGVATTSCVGTGLLFHHVALMAEGGLGREVAALLFIPYGLVTVGANVGAGALVDRLGPRRVLAVSLGAFAAMVVAVPLVASAAGVLAYGAAFGVMQGFQNNIAGSGFAYYFGRTHIGSIKGFSKTLLVAASALGPPLVALGAYAPGGYRAVLWASAAAVAGLAALALRTPEPA
ncbi:MAG: MFS transporter [Rubricoccaceae bacterium]